MPLDNLILGLLWRRIANAWRAHSFSDKAWVVGGGGLLTAYAIADVLSNLKEAHRRGAPDPAVALLILTIALAMMGAAAGRWVAAAAARMASAPYLLAQPIAPTSRRRMARRAAFVVGAGLGALAACAAGAALAAAGSAWPLSGAAASGAVFLLAFAIGALGTSAGDRSGRAAWAFSERFALACIERRGGARPAWLGSWAWELPGGRLALGPRRLATAAVFALCLALAMGASVAQHRAAPATVAGAFAGLVAFMLALRCHPLRSPALRAAPVAFPALCLRLVRLPLILSAIVFAGPAGAAVVAEPSAWSMPLAGAATLLLSNGAYAIFAAYFAAAPMLAAFGFVSAVTFFAYESFEYGRPVVLGFVALLFFLWRRAARRHRYG